METAVYESPIQPFCDNQVIISQNTIITILTTSLDLLGPVMKMRMKQELVNTVGKIQDLHHHYFINRKASSIKGVLDFK